MLKLTLKCIFSCVAMISFALLYFGSDQKDLKYLTPLLAAFGCMVMSCIDIRDYRKSRNETEASESVDRKKRLRAILDNFKASYHSGLIGLGIIKNKSELTYERIYELSQDADVVSLLNEHEYTGVRNDLEEYAELYTSVRKQGDVL